MKIISKKIPELIVFEISYKSCTGENYLRIRTNVVHEQNLCKTTGELSTKYRFSRLTSQNEC